MKKTIITIYALTIIGFIAFNQAKDKNIPTRQQTINTDSIPFISKADVITFNQILKSNATYDQYIKLTPENTLIALLNWKIEQLSQPKKQLTDSTQKK